MAGRWRRATLLLATVAVGATVLPAAESAGSGGYTGLLVLDASSGSVLLEEGAPSGRAYWTASLDGHRLVVSEAPCVEGTQVASVGQVASIDARSGRTRWEHRGFGAATKTMFWSDSATVPATASGTVVMGGGRFGSDVRGLHAGTGRQRWSMPTDHLELGVSATLQFAPAPGPDGALVLVGADRRTGTERWRFPRQPLPEWGRTFDVVAADAHTVVVGNGAYLGRSGDASGRTQPGGPTTFFVLDASSGLERSRFVVADPRFQFSDFRLAGSDLVLAEVGSGVVARSLVDGTVRWRYEAAPPGAVVDHDDEVTLRTSADADTVFAFDRAPAAGPAESARHTRVTALDVGTGRPRWHYDDAFLVSGGTDHTAVLELRGRSRAVTVVDTATGSVRWRRDLPARFATAGDLALGISGDRLLVAALCATE